MFSFSGRASALQAGGPRFSPQHLQELGETATLFRYSFIDSYSKASHIPNAQVAYVFLTHSSWNLWPRPFPFSLWGNSGWERVMSPMSLYLCLGKCGPKPNATLVWGIHIESTCSVLPVQSYAHPHTNPRTHAVQPDNCLSKISDRVITNAHYFLFPRVKADVCLPHVRCLEMSHMAAPNRMGMRPSVSAWTCGEVSLITLLQPLRNPHKQGGVGMLWLPCGWNL